MSVKTAINCAVSVMWQGPCQQALFVITLVPGSEAVVCDYDELLCYKGTFDNVDEVKVEAVVVPGEFDGECTIL